VESWSAVAAGAVDFVAFVDDHLMHFSGEIENCHSFFGAKFAPSGSEGLDAREGIPMPKVFDLDLDEVFDRFLVGAWWNERCKMIGK